MIQAIRQLSILNKVFNVRGSEWSSVLFSLIIRFFYRTAFVIGWTVLVALFASRYGILSLPYLFVINAVFSMIGSFLYSLFFERYSRRAIMIGTIFIAGVLLFLSVRLAGINQMLFFALLIVSISIFLNQLRIILIAYVEEMFTPLESERTFPIIEVSETLGGIIAGLAITLLADSFALSSFIYLLIGVLFLMIPFILFHKNETEEKGLLFHEHRHESVTLFEKVSVAFKNKAYTSYIIGLIWIVLLQWMIFNLLEFQYLKAVYQNVSEVIFEAGSGFEHAFVHDLGLLFILFSVSALIIEIFLGSRLITHLGVVGAMLLHPIVTLLGLFGLIVRFDFLTAVLAKNNFTMTSVIHTNTYHISYYALKEDFREEIREFLEGMIRPIGAIIGTVIIILLEKFFVSQELVFYINIVMLICTLIFFYVIYRQQDKYTHVAIHELLNSKEKFERMNAVDILAQRGHKTALAPLRKVLLDENEPVSLRVKILKVLVELKNPDIVLEIIQCLDSDKPEIYETAIDTLTSFKFLRDISPEYLFIKYRLILALKRLYSIEKNKEILAKIIHLMSLLSNVATVEFLFKILNSKNSSNKAEAIRALGGSYDEKIAQVLETYLHSKNPIYQINAALALTNFWKYRFEAMHLINSFLYSDKKEKIVYGLFAVGELKLKNKRQLCLKYLHSDDINLRLQSSIALAKMGFYNCIPSIIDLLFSDDEEFVRKLKRLLVNVDVRIFKNIDKIVRQIVSRKIEDLMTENKNHSLMDFSVKSLNKLKKLYTLIGEYEEIESINKLLKI